LSTPRGSDCGIPNTHFDWVRYDIEVPPVPCSVAFVAPDQGLTAEPGGVLDITWSLDGYEDGEVYLSIFSGWNPAQHHFNAIVDNDGHHAWTLPATLDPSLKYSVYVESVVDGARSQHCWEYTPLDVLPFTSNTVH